MTTPTPEHFGVCMCTCIYVYCVNYVAMCMIACMHACMYRAVDKKGSGLIDLVTKVAMNL